MITDRDSIRSGIGDVPKQRRGFAVMDRARQREIASKGGKAAHASKKAHQWTREQAVEAGRKGGLAISRDREHMARIGEKGGAAVGGASRRSLRGL